MIPEKLTERLNRLGMNESIYGQRTRKCILSRKNPALERVPWYEHAYFIPEVSGDKESGRSIFGTSYSPFIFDPVSLVPCLALEPKKHERILDMCAAPGTKTFILSFLTENEAHITSNDISFQRTKRLRFNVEKFGLSADVTNKSGRKIGGEFDKILLDAPCSGEGMVNKKDKLFDHWSEKSVRLLAKKQKKLITHAFDLLKEGGILVYSTCTFEREENEDVVEFLLKKRKARLEEIKVKINHSTGLTEGTEKCMRIYPQHNGTGGFFTARIRK